MGVMTDRLSLFKDKRVLITGHTGFKGSWLSRIFAMAGAELAGYALPAEELSMYRLCKQDSILKSYEGDVRDFFHLRYEFFGLKVHTHSRYGFKLVHGAAREAEPRA